MKASNRRSTTSEPIEALKVTGWVRLNAYARANSPTRMGSKLLAMKPIAVLANRARYDTFRKAGLRNTCQRAARMTKVPV